MRVVKFYKRFKKVLVLLQGNEYKRMGGICTNRQLIRGNSTITDA